MSDKTLPADLSRGDFLKLAGLSALLPLLGGASPAAAADEKPERLYIVTHAADDADRAALALILSTLDVKKIGRELSGVTLWFTLAGATLCKRGEAEKITSPVFRKFGTLADILRSAADGGAKLAACPFCLDALGLEKSDTIEGLERKGGDYVVSRVGKAQVIWL